MSELSEEQKFSRENFRGLIKSTKTAKVFSQWNFYRLQYSYAIVFYLQDVWFVHPNYLIILKISIFNFFATKNSDTVLFCN